MQNLLHETEQTLCYINKKLDDIQWIGSYDGTVADSWDAFKLVADRPYNPGYGLQEVAHDLVIVFTDDSWLERRAYDGSEYWEHKSAPALALQTPHSLLAVFTDSIGGIEDLEGDDAW